jgi:glycosyltransferase involved in cell wall biosynthesis
MEATTLAAAGYRVSVIAPTSDQRRREHIDGVAVYRFKAPPPSRGPTGYAFEYLYSMARAFGISLRILVREGFDVVHAHNPPDTFVLIALVYKLLGKRFVFDHHDLSPEMYEALAGERKSRALHRLLLLFERLSCRVADHVLAPNESYKEVEMDRDRVAGKYITVVRNGPDHALVDGARGDPALRGDTKGLIGYAGVIGYQDGLGHLLRALHHLVHEYGRSDILCLIVGDGNAGAEMRALAAELGLRDHVRFTGWVPHDEVLHYMASVDVCASPEPSNSYTDRSTMVKIMEYMAVGKPIVAFDLPEHRVTAGGAAVYAQANDESDFAHALHELLADPERRAAMGALGRQRVESSLAWSHSKPHLLAAYSRLANGSADAGATTRS